MKSSKLNTILKCTSCNRLIEGEDYEREVARIHATPFPQAVIPYKCPSCLEVMKHEPYR